MPVHKPVLVREVLTLLNPQKGQLFVDCTLGGGGHTRELTKEVGDKGKVIALDFSRENIQAFKQGKSFANVTAVWGNFKNIEKILGDLGIKKVDGILADLGFSSGQLLRVKGLSFEKDEPLDMRLDSKEKLTAAEILNTYSKEEIEEILANYGEERRAGCIAEEIIKARKIKKITRTFQLVGIVKKCWGREKLSGINVATKTFMALRIAVNGELENLKKLLESSKDLLIEGGRVGIISFHSLEDRIVKNFFKRESRKCVCDEDQIRCTCDHEPAVKIITKKPVIPSQREIDDNPRSRSAKLRVAEKII